MQQAPDPKEYSDVDLLAEIINMKLALGIQPSSKLIYYLENHLMQGRTATNLAVYKVLPRREQIVKLLRPEYDVEVDMSKFRIFTISRTIYNIASLKYTIKDDYRNACSIWYIEQIKDKIVFNRDTLTFFIIHGPWTCLRYIMDNYITPVPDDLDTCINYENIDALSYILARHNYLPHVYKYAIKYNNSKIFNFLGPLMATWGGKEDLFIDKKRIDVIKRMGEICPLAAEEYLFKIITVGWVAGLKAIINKVIVDMNTLYHAAHCDNIEILKIIYNKLAEEHDPTYILVETAETQSFYTFKLIRDLCPIYLKPIINLSKIQSKDVLEYCVTQGCTYNNAPTGV